MEQTRETDLFSYCSYRLWSTVGGRARCIVSPTAKVSRGGYNVATSWKRGAKSFSLGALLTWPVESARHHAH